MFIWNKSRKTCSRFYFSRKQKYFRLLKWLTFHLYRFQRPDGFRQRKMEQFKQNEMWTELHPLTTPCLRRIIVAELLILRVSLCFLCQTHRQCSENTLIHTTFHLSHRCISSEALLSSTSDTVLSSSKWGEISVRAMRCSLGMQVNLFLQNVSLTCTVFSFFIFSMLFIHVTF